MPIPSDMFNDDDKKNTSLPNLSESPSKKQNDDFFAGLPDFDELISDDDEEDTKNDEEEDVQDDDQTFTPISVDEEDDYDEDENQSINDSDETFTPINVTPINDSEKEKKQAISEYQKQQIIEQELKKKQIEEALQKSYSNNSTVSEQKPSVAKHETENESHKQKEYIDTKKRKLKPFGYKKIKVDKFDSRNNIRKKAQYVQIFTVILVVIMLLLGVKNAIFPQKTLTTKDVTNIVDQEMSITKFPLTRGEGFAKDFMQAYLTVDSTTESTSSAVLGYYYTGSLEQGDSSTNRSVGSNYTQKVIYGPTVYDATALTNYSAKYTISALVESGTTDSEPPSDGSTAKWITFNVNVYYNSKKDAFNITKDSPTLVPNSSVGNQSDVPDVAKLGNGNQDAALTKKVSSVVKGFINGYQSSSSTNHSALDQYVVPNANASLLKGLNNKYVLAGTIDDAVKYVAYDTDEKGIVKVSVTVNWRSQVDTANQQMVDYTSTYVMTLQKQGSKYLVQNFAPEYFFK